MAADNVFMIGWEYPPHNSGGLGVACKGLTQALSEQGQRIYFTLPYQHTSDINHMRVVGCFDKKWFKTGENLKGPPFANYHSPVVAKTMSSDLIDAHKLHALPQSEMEHRVNQYADYVAETADDTKDDFGVVHAHDWMSFPAAMKIKQQLKKPYIAHVHSTEFDRIPHGNGSHYIMKTEYEGMQLANRVIAVSNYTKQLLVKKYHIDPHKIDVVYNGIDPLQEGQSTAEFAHQRPVVVFMGRLTMQKGGEYFVDLARHVLHEIPEALFVVAGDGDQYYSLMLKNAASSLSAHLLFAGFVRNQQKAALLNRANVFVMPSLSEPFGLVALEAAQRKTPVIVSKNSGVAEVMPSAKIVDFWDMGRMTQEIVHLVKDKQHHQQVVDQQLDDVNKVTWGRSANKIKKIYSRFFGLK